MSNIINNKKIVTIYNKIQLHSRYNPTKEANKFVNHHFSKTIITNKNRLIIIGESLGFILEAIIKYDFDKIYIIINNSDFYKILSSKIKQIKYKNVKLIQINKEEKFSTVLSKYIKNSEISQLKTISWPAYLKADKQMHLFYNKMFPTWLKQQIASITTEIVFAEKWFINSIINYSQIENYYKINRGNYPVIITAAGSNLKNSLDCLQMVRKKVFLIALSASVTTLFEADITPDIIIQTDPGYWSSQITNKAINYYKTNKIKPIIMMPFSASPIKIKNSPTILINQLNEIDNLLCANNYTNISVFETGSVACTALLVASQITNSSVYFMGLDLDIEKELHHVISHLSIKWLIKESDKTTPLQNKLFSTMQKSKSNALLIFKEWFTNYYQSNQNFRRIEPVISKYPNNTISQEQLLKEFDSLTELDRKKIIVYLKDNKNSNQKIKKILSELELSTKSFQLLAKKIAKDYLPLEYEQIDIKSIKNKIDSWISKSKRRIGI